MTQLEVVYLMNVVLYFDSLATIRKFLFVSKRCTEAINRLKTNPPNSTGIMRVKSILKLFPSIQRLHYDYVRLHEQLTEEDLVKFETFETIVKNELTPYSSIPLVMKERMKIQSSRKHSYIKKVPIDLRNCLLLEEVTIYWTRYSSEINFIENVCQLPLLKRIRVLDIPSKNVSIFCERYTPIPLKISIIFFVNGSIPTIDAPHNYYFLSNMFDEQLLNDNYFFNTSRLYPNELITVQWNKSPSSLETLLNQYYIHYPLQLNLRATSDSIILSSLTCVTQLKLFLTGETNIITIPISVTNLYVHGIVNTIHIVSEEQIQKTTVKIELGILQRLETIRCDKNIKLILHNIRNEFNIHAPLLTELTLSHCNIPTVVLSSLLTDYQIPKLAKLTCLNVTIASLCFVDTSIKQLTLDISDGSITTMTLPKSLFKVKITGNIPQITNPDVKKYYKANVSKTLGLLGQFTKPFNLIINENISMTKSRYYLSSFAVGKSALLDFDVFVVDNSSQQIVLGICPRGKDYTMNVNLQDRERCAKLMTLCDIYDPNSLTTYVFDTTNIYDFILMGCSLSFPQDINIYSPELYLLLCCGFMCVTIIYLVICYVRRQHIKNLHYVLGGLILSYVIKSMLQCLYFFKYEINNHPSNVLLVISNTFNGISECGLLVLCCLITMGYSTILERILFRHTQTYVMTLFCYFFITVFGYIFSNIQFVTILLLFFFVLPMTGRFVVINRRIITFHILSDEMIEQEVTYLQTKMRVIQLAYVCVFIRALISTLLGSNNQVVITSKAYITTIIYEFISFVFIILIIYLIRPRKRIFEPIDFNNIFNEEPSPPQIQHDVMTDIGVAYMNVN
ncbi:hypothetical protein QTN25_000858 [Entamoeba marina]